MNLSPVSDLERHIRDPLANDLLVGAREIGEYIGRSQSSTYRLLTRGSIPGGRIGTGWVSSKRTLGAFFAELTSGRKV